MNTNDNSLKNFTAGAADRISLLFYPPACAFCGRIMPRSKTGVYICPDCMSELRFCVNEDCCSICGAPVSDSGHHLCSECFNRRAAGHRTHYNRIISACVYDDAAKGGILRYKSGAESGSATTFAGLIAAVAGSAFENAGLDLVGAVPPRRQRMLGLGFDQCHALAKLTARRLGLPYVKNMLIRRRDCRKQTELSGNERRVNLSGAFGLNVSPDKIRGRSVLIIDDVKTTGSTFDECARVLKEKGAARVYGASVATTDFFV